LNLLLDGRVERRKLKVVLGNDDVAAGAVAQEGGKVADVADGVLESRRVLQVPVLVDALARFDGLVPSKFMGK
jgi:hypothetical protein